VGGNLLFLFLFPLFATITKYTFKRVFDFFAPVLGKVISFIPFNKEVKKYFYSILSPKSLTKIPYIAIIPLALL